MSANWIERWDRFTCNDPSHPMHGQTVEVTARKMHGYLVSAVTGARWVRKSIPLDALVAPTWTPAPAPTDMDEAVRVSVLNTIAESDGYDDSTGTPLLAILDTIEQRSGKHPSIAYVTALLASIGATERDGLWSVAALPDGWAWKQGPYGHQLKRGKWWIAGVTVEVDDPGSWFLWTEHTGKITEGSEPTQDAAIERATWECRRRGLFATPPERAERTPLPCDTMRRTT